MAGGVTKGFGITFLILGLILIIGGIAAAGFGFSIGQREEERGLFGDPEQQDLASALLTGGAIAGGVGVALLVVGGILAAIGGGMAQRELLRAMRGSGTADRAPATRRTGWIVAGAIVGILLLAVGVYALRGGSDGGALSAFSAPAHEPADTIVANKTYEGYVQGVRAPILGGLNTGNADAVHELSLTPGILTLVGTLHWTADAPTSASTLVLILEANNAGAWEEIGRGEGGPGLAVEVPATSLPETVRARVFVGGSGAADQEYTLDLVARMP